MKNSKCWYKDVCNKECFSTCIRYLEMKALMESSNIPENRQKPMSLTPSKCDYDAFKQLAEIKDNIVDFVNNGNNLYISSSSTGNGKTSWAIKLMLKYFNDIWAGNGFICRGIFIHTPTFLLQCKDFSKVDQDFDDLKRRLDVVDLVIWDDIASTDISSYDYSQLLRYIDARSLNNKSNIFTGNLVTSSTLEKAVGSKLASRIMSKQTTCITFEGGDRR